MGSWRAISYNIALRGRGFLRPRSNLEGTPCRPRDSTEDVKNRGRGGYIVGYSPTRPHIYNIYTSFRDSIKFAILIRSNVKTFSLMAQLFSDMIFIFI